MQTKVSSFIVIFEGYNIFGIVIQFGLSVHVCLLSGRTQISEHYILNCHPPHVKDSTSVFFAMCVVKSTWCWPKAAETCSGWQFYVLYSNICVRSDIKYRILMCNKPSNTTKWCPYKLYYWQDDMFRSIKGPSSGPVNSKVYKDITFLCLMVYCTLIFLVFHTTVWKTQELL